MALLPSPPPLQEAVVVLDLKGINQLGLFHFLNSPASKQASGVAPGAPARGIWPEPFLATSQENDFNLDFFPESLGKVIIINAPLGIGTLWNLLSPLLPPRTRGKIAIVGGKPLWFQSSFPSSVAASPALSPGLMALTQLRGPSLTCRQLPQGARRDHRGGQSALVLRRQGPLPLAAHATPLARQTRHTRGPSAHWPPVAYIDLA